MRSRNIFFLIGFCATIPIVKGVNLGLQLEQHVIVFDKEAERTQRSVSKCDSTQFTNISMSRESPFTILCSCGMNKTSQVDWKDENCTILDGNLETAQKKTQYDFIPPAAPVHRVVLYCSSEDCIEKFSITVEDDVSSGMSAGLQGFLIFVCVSVVALSLLFVGTRYKTHIYLGFRDTCRANARDGNDIDAYVSTGKNQSDRKFLERNVLDVLRREHNYRFYIDDDNLLPQLEYSEKIKEKIRRCHLLIIVFTATYMTNDWCMYCFNEGLRKLLELNKPLLFLISDLTIQRELNSYTALVGHVPKVFIPLVQTEKEKQRMLREIRLRLPGRRRRMTKSQDIRAPMLSDAEDMDRSSIRTDVETYGGTETKYTFPKSVAQGCSVDDVSMDDINTAADDFVFDESEDPSSIRVKQYQARKDFYSLTPATDEA